MAKLDGTNGLIQQYDYQVLTTAFSYTFAAGTQTLIINPAGTLATGTVTMPAAPADGMVITVESTQIITALTLSGNTGQSIVGVPATLFPNQPMSYVYRLSNTTWYPFSVARSAVLQVVNYQTGAVMTGGASTIAYSDAIPTNTQGTEFFTLAITPTSATSKLLINFSTVLNHTTSTAVLNTCLFQDSIAGALTVATSQNVNNGGFMVVSGSHYMTAGTTSSTTFKIRCGSASGATVTLNGVNGTRFYGGTSNSYITIMEIAA